MDRLGLVMEALESSNHGNNLPVYICSVGLSMKLFGRDELNQARSDEGFILGRAGFSKILSFCLNDSFRSQYHWNLSEILAFLRSRKTLARSYYFYNGNLGRIVDIGSRVSRCTLHLHCFLNTGELDVYFGDFRILS